MGLSTAFLTGFVDAANRDMYETRMAAHQESVEARANFQWKQRKDEEDAREDEQIKAKNAREDRLTTEQRTYNWDTDAKVRADQVTADRAEQDRLAQERAPMIAALHPELTEEQVNMWSRQPETVITGLINSASEGQTWSAKHNRLVSKQEVELANATRRVEFNRPTSTNGIPMPDNLYPTTPYGRMLQSYFASGRDEEDLIADGYTKNVTYDANGVPNGAEVIYADPDMYEPLQFERDRLDIAFSTSINAINQLMPDLLFDKEGNILKGDAAIAINILRNRALKEYSKIRSTGQSIDENYIVNRVFEEFEALVPALAGDNKQRADNLINDTLYVDTIATMSGEELFLIHQNLGDRIRLSDNDIITPGSPVDTRRMQAVGDAIEDNAMFKAYVGELEGETGGAGTPPPLVPAGAEAGHDFFIRETFDRDIISYNSQISALQEARSEALALQTKLQSQYTDLVARLDTGEIIPGYAPGMEQSYLKSSGEKTEEVRGIDAQIQALQTQINAATTAFKAAQQTVVE